MANGVSSRKYGRGDELCLKEGFLISGISEIDYVTQMSLWR